MDNLLARLRKWLGGSATEVDPRVVHNRLATSSGPLILDVREPAEYRSGHIPGAKLIPLGGLAQQMQGLPRGREIVCVCRSGNRSRSAVRQLTAAGYRAVNLRGGMLAWSGAKLPLRKGDR